MASNFLYSLARRKTVEEVEKTKLNRCLTLLDLTSLGVGGTLGLGVYVLAGAVAKTVAGPAICLSFLVAAVASAVAGLCYAEFASRVPRAGSAYVYSYVTVGEFIAYIIGWNLILEYVIGTASGARGLTNYIDALVDNKISNALMEWMPIKINYLSEYPDLLAFFIIMLLTILLCIGVKESTMLNNIFTVLNLSTVGVVIITGAIKADTSNWSLPKEKVPTNAGEGGFMPFGWSGVMAGAAKCFYGYVGFDGVATTGEEAKNPQKDIPWAIVLCLTISCLAYFGISTVLTMMWPYYDQDKNAPFPYVYDQVGWPSVKWIVNTGSLFALSTSMMGGMFPLPRVIYAMANDGLIFKKLAEIHPKTQTPMIATIASGLFSGVMAAVFNLEQLIDMMSIGTLLAYTIVAVCVLILRYKPAESKSYPCIKEKGKVENNLLFIWFKTLFNLNMNKFPTSTSSKITSWSVVVYSIFSGILCTLIINRFDSITPEKPLFLTSFIAIILIMVMCIFIIYRQPVEEVKLSFKVPFVPLLPCLSVLFNLYLMLELDLHTWIRFIVWLIIGFSIYFLYGIKNSKEGIKRNREKNINRPEVYKEDLTKF